MGVEPSMADRASWTFDGQLAPRRGREGSSRLPQSYVPGAEKGPPRRPRGSALPRITGRNGNEAPRPKGTGPGPAQRSPPPTPTSGCTSRPRPFVRIRDPLPPKLRHITSQPCAAWTYDTKTRKKIPHPTSQPCAAWTYGCDSSHLLNL